MLSVRIIDDSWSINDTSRVVRMMPQPEAPLMLIILTTLDVSFSIIIFL